MMAVAIASSRTKPATSGICQISGAPTANSVSYHSKQEDSVVYKGTTAQIYRFNYAYNSDQK